VNAMGYYLQSIDKHLFSDCAAIASLVGCLLPLDHPTRPIHPLRQEFVTNSLHRHHHASQQYRIFRERWEEQRVSILIRLALDAPCTASPRHQH